MIQEYEKKHEQDKIVLPISCVRDNGFDQYTFLEASGMQWDSYLALKHFRIVVSVLKNFTKSAKLFMVFGCSLEVSCTRVCISICIGSD